MVILGHIQYISETTRVFLVSFHMPLFFILSGLLMQISSEKERPLIDNIHRKARRMLLPYFVYSCLDIIIYIGYYLLTGRDGGWPTVFMDIAMSLTFYGMSVLWFLPAIFIAEVLFLVLLRMGERIAGLFSGLLWISAYFLNTALENLNRLKGQDMIFSLFHLFSVALLRGIICMGFIAIGYYISLGWSHLGRREALSPIKFSSITKIADLFLGFDFLVLTFVLSWINGMTDLHFLLLGNPFIYILAAVSGSLGVILLCKAFEGASRGLRLISYYGKNSLMVMATHLDFYVLLAAEIGAQHFTKYMTGNQKNTAFIILTFIFTLIGEMVIIEAYTMLKKRVGVR